MSVEVSYLISFVFGVAGFTSVLFNLSRSRKQELTRDASENAGVAFELKALQNSLMEFKTEIKISMDSNSRMTLENHDKIIKLEADMKTAFLRIDELREAVRS